MIKLIVCPSCGSRNIRRVRRDWRGETRGQTYKVANLTFHECPDCGEKVFGREAMRRMKPFRPPSSSL